MPQRDVVGRLARREFTAISDEMAYRFRDVHDHMVRYADEVMLFQERLTGIHEINLATVSNRLNSVMKVLTVISSIFLPLTLIAGIYGMNFEHMPELERRYAYPAALAAMAAIGAGMWIYFVRRGFIGGPKVRDLARPAKAAGRVGRGLASAALLPIKVTTRATNQLLNGPDDPGP